MNVKILSTLTVSNNVLVSGYFMLYDTQPKFTFNNVWVTVKHTSHFRFTVAACNNAYIFMTSIIGVTSMFMYEVKLTNSKSTIFQGHEGWPYVQVNTPNILNCQIPQQFWVSWINGNVRVGKGTIVGSQTIMDWQDMNPRPIASIGLATDQIPSSAEWTFLLDESAYP